MRLLSLPSQKRPISQERLHELVTLSNTYVLVKKEVEKRAQSVLDELLDGNVIEEGTHIAEVKTVRSGRQIKHKLDYR